MVIVAQSALQFAMCKLYVCMFWKLSDSNGWLKQAAQSILEMLGEVDSRKPSFKGPN